MQIELVAIALLIGAMSGFFSMGGGVILVPILLYFGFGIKEAIGFSIYQMLITSTFGTFLNNKYSKMNFRHIFPIALGAILGGSLAGFITYVFPIYLLELIFLCSLIVSLYATLKNARVSEVFYEIHSVSKSKLFLISALISSVSVSTGIGGGLLLSAVLINFLKVYPKESSSVALFFIIFASLAAVLSNIYINELISYDAIIFGFVALGGVFLGIKIKNTFSDKKYKLSYLFVYIPSLLYMSYELFFRSN